jgi:hypothetical protein
MDIVDMAIHQVVCQKSDFQNSQILVQEIDPWCITKLEKDILMLFGLFDSAHTF